MLIAHRCRGMLKMWLEDDRLAHVPLKMIDIRKTIEFNVSIHGTDFYKMPIGQKLIDMMQAQVGAVREPPLQDEQQTSNIYDSEFLKDKIIVKRNNMPTQEQGQQTLRVAELSTLNEADKQKVVQGFKMYLRDVDDYVSSPLRSHETFIKRIISELQGTEQIDYPHRIYIAFRQSEENESFVIEGFMEVSKQEDNPCWGVTLWEIHPFNWEPRYLLDKKKALRFKGVGRQLLRYVVNKELKKDHDFFIFFIFAPGPLSAEGLKGRTILDKEELQKYLEIKSKEMIKLLEDAAKPTENGNFDAGAKEMLDKINGKVVEVGAQNIVPLQSHASDDVTVQEEEQPMTFEDACSLLSRKSIICIDDLENSKLLAAQILKEPINKIMVVGNGASLLAPLLALMGKDVTFVDQDPGAIRLLKLEIMRVKHKTGRDLNIKTVCSEIGTLKYIHDDYDIQENSYDLITFMDLVGGIPIGEPEQWLLTARKFLKEKGYILIDETCEARNTMHRYFHKVFPLSKPVANGRLFRGDYNSYAVNRFYSVENEHVADDLANRLINPVISWVESRYIETRNRDQEFIIALETSWISDMQMSLSQIQTMIHQGFKKINKRRGLQNVHVVINNDPAKVVSLVNEIRDESEKVILLENIAFLGENDILSSNVFKDFVQEEESSYFGKIKLPENYKEISSSLDMDLTRLLINFLTKISISNSPHEVFLTLPDINEYELDELVAKYDRRTESLTNA